MSAIVIVPTYKERENLPELFELVWRGSPDLNVLVVDDYSGDGTPEYVKGLPQYGSAIFLLERKTKDGLARAYLEGFDWALQRGHQFILQMDADLSHDPLDLPRLLTQAKAGHDLALASRYYQGVRVLNWEISRLLLSLWASVYVRFFTRMPFADPTSGFKCYGAEMLRKIVAKRISSQGYSFQIETLFWTWMLGGKVCEVPIIFGQRKNGDSKMSGAIAVEASWQVLRLGLLEIWLRLKGQGRREPAGAGTNGAPVS